MHVWYTKAENRNAYRVLVVKPVGKSAWEILCFVDCASLYNLVIKANLVPSFS